jgi:hypothetical protein
MEVDAYYVAAEPGVTFELAVKWSTPKWFALGYGDTLSPTPAFDESLYIERAIPVDVQSLEAALGDHYVFDFTVSPTTTRSESPSMFGARTSSLPTGTSGTSASPSRPLWACSHSVGCCSYVAGHSQGCRPGYRSAMQADFTWRDRAPGTGSTIGAVVAAPDRRLLHHEVRVRSRCSHEPNLLTCPACHGTRLGRSFGLSLQRMPWSRPGQT